LRPLRFARAVSTATQKALPDAVAGCRSAIDQALQRALRGIPRGRAPLAAARNPAIAASLAWNSIPDWATALRAAGCDSRSRATAGIHETDGA